VTLINITPIKNHAMRSPAGPPTARADPEPTNKPVPIDPPAQGMTKSGNLHSEKIHTDSDHSEMPRLHFLLQHRSISHNFLNVFNIVAASDYLTTDNDKKSSELKAGSK